MADNSTLSIPIYADGANWLAEKNRSTSASYIGDLLGGQALTDIALTLRFLQGNLPPLMLDRLPGLGVYPGPNYVALGSSRQWSYSVIRGDSQECAVYKAADRDSESGGDVAFHRPMDALKSVILDWISVDILGLRETLWRGEVCAAEVEVERFSWAKHRNLYTVEKQRDILARSRRAAESGFYGDDAPSVEQVIEGSNLLYTAKDDPEAWFISETPHVAADLTWGLAVSGEEYVDRVFRSIQSGR